MSAFPKSIFLARTGLGAVSLAVLLALGACTNKNPMKLSDVNKPTPPKLPAGAVTIRTFNQYYHAMRLCTGVSFAGTDSVLTYDVGAARLLPQSTSAAVVNDATAQTAVKLASFFASAFLAAELAKPATSRLALAAVDGTRAAQFTAAVVEDVTKRFVPLCLGRAATADDVADAQKASRDALGNAAPSSIDDVKKALLVILTGILSSGEMLASN